MRKQIVMLGLVAALATTTACGNLSFLGGNDNKVSSGTLDSLATYKGLTIDYSVSATAVSDESIEQTMESSLSAITEERDKNYKAKKGDIVNIDYEGLKDGVAFDGGTSAGYDLTLGSNTFIDGFEDGLIGVKTGDKKDLNLTFPEEYSSEELAGQDVVFKVTVNKISTPLAVDELTDDVVANKIKTYTDTDGNQVDVATVEQYKEAIKADLQAQYDEEDKEAKKNAIWKELLDKSTIKEYSEEELEKLKSDMDNNYQLAAQSYGYDDFEEFVKATGSTMDEYNEGLEKTAKEEIASRIITAVIAKKEKLEVTEEELQAGKEEFVKKYKYESVESMEEAAGKDVVELEIQREKVKNWLLENNTFHLTQATDAQ